jgi:hypothetical protein
VLLSAYESRSDIELLVGLAVRLRELGAQGADVRRRTRSSRSFWPA